MYEDNQWDAVTGEELEGFLAQVNPIDQKLTVSPSTATVEWRQLPWYDSVAMIRVRDESWTQNNLTVYYPSQKVFIQPRLLSRLLKTMLLKCQFPRVFTPAYRVRKQPVKLSTKFWRGP